MPQLNESESSVREIAKAIRDLSRQATDGWVQWKLVAKKMTGTAEYADVLIAIADLDRWRPMFAMNDGVVKLTRQGLQFAAPITAQPLTEIQHISRAVTQYAGRLHDIWLEVRGISRVATVGSRVVQAVEVDHDDEPVASETPVQFCPAGAPTRGKIVGQEADGSVLYVAFDAEIFPASLPGKLRIDRGYLLNCLASSIEALPSVPARMRTILHECSDDFFVAGHDSLSVGNSLAKLRTPWTRFLWGPPGAGKTFALAQIVSCQLQAEPNGTILVVAPSNRSVDVATEEIVRRLEANGQGQTVIANRKVVRFGYPRKSEIIGRPELLGPPELDELNSRVRELAKLIERAGRDEIKDADLALLRAQLLAAQDAVKAAVAAHVSSASVVATTTTLAYLQASSVPAQTWNSVIVDEVTMVTPAMCVFLASLARDRLLLAGDPRQLGPVYESGSGAPSEDYEWMGRDVFDLGGVSIGQREQRQIKTNDSRLARIASQRRCAPAIWGRVEHLYPGVSNIANADKLRTLIELEPSPGESIVVLDTSDWDAKCEPMRGSWQNPQSADLAISVAVTVAAESPEPLRIAIITPYRAQVRLLQQRLRAEGKAVNKPYDQFVMEAGTIHQFQGSDADVVIFDLVDGRGRTGVGKLLRDDAGIRLVNVAITRAKGKLIVIADKKWSEASRVHNVNALLGELVLGYQSRKTLRVQQSPPPSPDVWLQREKTESPIETALFDAMAAIQRLSTVRGQVLICDKLGVPVSRADFAFEEIKYAVYCDGRQWHLREDRWEHDLRQRNKLAELGWSFSVFTGRQINRDAHGCAAQVLETYTKRLESLMRHEQTIDG